MFFYTSSSFTRAVTSNVRITPDKPGIVMPESGTGRLGG